MERDSIESHVIQMFNFSKGISRGEKKLSVPFVIDPSIFIEISFLIKFLIASDVIYIQ